MKIYTCAGDRGQTGLASGKRVDKHTQRLECLGAVDELSACIGLAASFLKQAGLCQGAARLYPRLRRIQIDLSSLCAELALAGGARIGARQVKALERAIDAWSAQLPPLRGFILPDGGHASACLHMARTICRRAEREAVRLAAQEPVPSPILAYLNRLSDALFTAARSSAFLCGQAEIPVKRP